MSGGIITGAWIQSAPLWLAAAAAVYGLGTWRKQLAGKRHIERAERVYSTGREALTAIRLVRSRVSTHGCEDVRDRNRLKTATKQLIRSRVERAWIAWQSFSDNYQVLFLYEKAIVDKADLAADLADCLSKLSGDAEMVLLYEEYALEDPEDRSLRQQLVGLRRALSGDPEGDETEKRLRDIEELLKQRVRAVVSPKIHFFQLMRQ